MSEYFGPFFNAFLLQKNGPKYSLIFHSNFTAVFTTVFTARVPWVPRGTRAPVPMDSMGPMAAWAHDLPNIPQWRCPQDSSNLRGGRCPPDPPPGVRGCDGSGGGRGDGDGDALLPCICL